MSNLRRRKLNADPRGMFRGQIGKGDTMKPSYRWLGAGVATLALMGCLQSGSTYGSRTNTENEMAFSAMQEPFVVDSGKGPEMGLPGPGFADELGLSEDQKVRIRDAIKDVHDRLKPKTPPRERPSFLELKAKHAEMRDSIWAAVMAILDSSQQAHALAIRNEIESGARPCPRAMEHIQQLTEKLGLDSAQAQAVTAILSGEPQRMHEAFEAAVSFEDLRARVDAIHADQDARILALLSESQAEAFKVFKAEHKPPPGPGGPPTGDNVPPGANQPPPPQ